MLKYYLERLCVVTSGLHTNVFSLSCLLTVTVLLPSLSVLPDMEVVRVCGYSVLQQAVSSVLVLIITDDGGMLV